MLRPKPISREYRARFLGAPVWGALILYLLFAGLAPSTGTARWRRPNDIFFGTAYTLPEKRMRIGVFAPLSYGVHENVTLSTHPILDLLLTPNISVRVKLIDRRITVSGAAAYTQSFYVGNDSDANGQTRVFGIASLTATERLIFTVTGGIAQELTEEKQTADSSLSAHYRIDQRNIMMVQGGLASTLDSDDAIQARGLLFYAFAFRSFKAGAGLAFGKMPGSLGSLPLTDDDIRVVPYLDVWWTF